MRIFIAAAIALAASFNAIAAPQSAAQKFAKDTEIQFGFCRPNLTWVQPREAIEILDSIKASGAKCVQLNMRDKYEPTYDFIKHCNSIKLPVLLEIMPLKAFMEDGAEERPGNGKLWKGFGLSQIDTAKFEASFREWISRFKEDNLEILGVEMFNEINWADFNGDLSITDGAIIIDEKNYKKYPFAKKYVAGMVKYAELIAIARKVIDEEYAGDCKLPKPMLLLGSFVLQNDSNWFQKTGASIVDADFHFKIMAGKILETKKSPPALALVDAYTAHIYPGAEDIDLKAKNYPKLIEKTVLKYVEPIFKYGDKNKFVFLTEFSFSSWLFRSEKDPQAARAEMTRRFMKSLSQNSLAKINWGGIFFYSYDNGDNWAAVAKDGAREPILALFKESFPRAVKK